MSSLSTVEALAALFFGKLFSAFPIFCFSYPGYLRKTKPTKCGFSFPAFNPVDRSFFRQKKNFGEDVNILEHGRQKGGEGIILKFDIFLLNFQQKRLFSQFQVGKKKFRHFWPPSGRILLATTGSIHYRPPQEKILPTPMDFTTIAWVATTPATAAAICVAHKKHSVVKGRYELKSIGSSIAGHRQAAYY